MQVAGETALELEPRGQKQRSFIVVIFLDEACDGHWEIGQWSAMSQSWGALFVDSGEVVHVV
jgi:hypothetical protein